MSVWLNVAEKPSVAKEVTNVLSSGSFRSVASSSRYNPVFEFAFQGKTMLFTSVSGHMMEDEFPPSAKSWAGFPFLSLFSTPITKRIRGDLEPLKRNLETLAKRASHLILWLDCDREGENICFEVISVVTAVKRSMSIHRAHFSALTARDLHGAMRNLKQPDKRLSDAVEARQELDLRVGAVFTRFQTVKFRDAYASMPRLLSFGPCQFPTLGFVVRRHLQREAFVPEDFFTFQMADGGTTVFIGTRGRVYDQIAATLVYEVMLARAAPQMEARVVDVVQRPVRRRPPVPLATVQLQKLAANHLRMSSERCMAEAESLYQEGFLSYPRTETDSFSFTNEELQDLVRVQATTAPVAEFVQRMMDDLPGRFRTPLRGPHDDKAHPPIHPTKSLPLRGDNSPREALYLLVVRHFLACVSPDAVAATTTVTAEFGEELFQTSGTTILDRGWLEVFTFERWHGSCIPNYQLHSSFRPTSVMMEKGRTAPPSHLTEAQLISLMDENGIGTDATIAQHIKTIQEREYVRREGQYFVPTPLGLALASAYEAIDLPELLDPEPRAQMELAMADIAHGAATKQDVINATVAVYRKHFAKLESRVNEFRGALSRYLVEALRNDRRTNDEETGGASRPGPAALDDLQHHAASGALGSGIPVGEEVRGLEVLKRGVSTCGVCSMSMDIVCFPTEAAAPLGAGRAGRVPRFARCLRCLVAHRLPGSPSVVFDPHEARCTACKFGVVTVTNRETGRSYTICPYCFSHPPAGAAMGELGQAEIEDAGDFRCFQCTLDCPLAKGLENIPIMKCVSCGGDNDLRLRTSAVGAFLSCRGFPTCSFTVSLPPAQAVVPHPRNRCPQCHAVMIGFTFSAGQQIPGMEMHEILCVSCDTRLRDYIVVRGYVPRSESSGGLGSGSSGQAYELPKVPAKRRGGGGSAAPRGRGRGSGDGSASSGSAQCACGQPAKMLTSRKEASMGRKFFTCAQRKCNFFEWASDE